MDANAELRSGTVVVGYDGRAGGRDALVLAGALADLDSSEVVVVAAASLAPTEAARLSAEARQLLGDRAAVTIEGDPAPSPADALERAAVRHHASLIVLGAAHPGTLGRIAMGSTGDRLLSSAPCAIAFAPSGFAHDLPYELRTIGVGFDGSLDGEDALTRAARVARSANARIRVISVLEPAAVITSGWAGMTPLPPYTEADQLNRRESVETEVDDRVARLDAKIETSREVVEGDAPAILAELSNSLDLLVLGSRGYGAVKRMLLGGVSAHVAHEALCPVLVVPRQQYSSQAPVGIPFDSAAVAG